MLILSRHQALVATSVVVSVLVAEAFVWLRHALGETDVAKARCYRNLLFVQLMSRQLTDVAT